MPSEADRAEAATRLGAERRRLFLADAILSLAVPVVPYLTGGWESAWYALAATGWPQALRAALFLAGFHAAFAVALAPLSFYGGYTLPHCFGLSRQSHRGWLADWLKGVAIGVFFGTLVGGAYLAAVVRLDGGWWWGFGLFLSAAVVLVTFLAPYVLVPLFFKMRPLADQATAGRIRDLVARAGAEVRDVCSLDFSRRTAEANAAVIGMGRSRRVVLADTLLAQFSAPEVDSVVAHEVGHHVNRDVPRLLIFSLAVLWVGLGAAGALAPRALPILSVPYLAYVPGYPMLLAVAELFVMVTAPLTNWWSRRLEAAADAFALHLTRDPAAFAAVMRRLADQNLVETRPPRWAEWLLATHPPIYRRVAMAESWGA